MLHQCQNVRALFTTHITSPAHSSDQFSAKTRPARTMKKWIAAAWLQHHTSGWPGRSQPVPHPVSSLKSSFCLGSEEQPPHHSKVVHTRWCNTFTSCHLRCQQFSELWAALTLPSRVSKHWRFCLVHCGWQVDQTISESRKGTTSIQHICLFLPLLWYWAFYSRLLSAGLLFVLQERHCLHVTSRQQAEVLDPAAEGFRLLIEIKMREWNICVIYKHT